MATKKKVTKKRAPRKKVTKKIQLRVENHPVIEDFFDPETNELLNPKHELFTQMWVQTFDRAKALAAGGYKKPTNRMSLYTQSTTILRREEVQLRVRAILRERVDQIAVNENFIVMHLLDVYTKAMEQKPIFDHEGNEIGYEYQDLKVAQTTLKDLGVNLGMFQKNNEKQAASVVINMNYGDDQKQIPAITGESKRLN